MGAGPKPVVRLGDKAVDDDSEMAHDPELGGASNAYHGVEPGAVARPSFKEIAGGDIQHQLGAEQQRLGAEWRRGGCRAKDEQAGTPNNAK
jgi:hypothetical protein